MIFRGPIIDDMIDRTQREERHDVNKEKIPTYWRNRVDRFDIKFTSFRVISNAFKLEILNEIVCMTSRSAETVRALSKS